MLVVTVLIVSVRVIFVTDGKLYFGQLPLVEMDGLNLVQHNATIRYIAEKGKLIPEDPKDRFRFVQAIGDIILKE